MPQASRPGHGQSSRPRQRPSARAGTSAAAVRRLAARQVPPRDQAPERAPGEAVPSTGGAPPFEVTPAEATPALPEPADVLPADALPEAGDLATRAAAERLPWGLLTFVALTVVTLVCGGLATWFGTQAGAVTSAPSASNHALSDPGETSQVTSQVTGAVQRLFSYDYANPAPTQNAAAALLTGVAVKQYATLFAAVKQAAMKNKLVVTTTVSQAGVETLSGGTARVLVFATESNGSAGASAPTTAEAMLAVNAVRTGSAWKIEGLDTFTR